jgi:hypothetical protein
LEQGSTPEPHAQISGGTDLRCRCEWRGERCTNQATQEDGLCNWCGNGRTIEQQRDDPKAVTGPNGEFYGISGAGQLHDSRYPGEQPAACWYPNSGRQVLNDYAIEKRRAMWGEDA